MISADAAQRVEKYIPGITAAYGALLSDHQRGIHTSDGSLYNHTFFGRDASMTAKFVTEFDHSVVRDTIHTLATLQGVENNRLTQEEVGRIHHEWRDFQLWRGTFRRRLLLWPMRYAWGGNHRLLLTYFAADSAASYIRLVHKYSTLVDSSILQDTITDKSGAKVTIATTVERAAAWIQSHVANENLLMTSRSNSFSLPFQTFQDSVTAYSRRDGSLMNYKKSIGYVEVQAFSADALSDAVHMLPDNQLRASWEKDKNRLKDGLFGEYWRDDNFFASCIDANGPDDRQTVAAGWTLNTSLWDKLPPEEYQAKLSSIVRHLFSSDFLTSVGLRTRALSEPKILQNVVEYHGSLTVWPMFTFMVSEGLRRHNLHRLAEQLENRMMNGLNLTGNFDEFFIVDGDGVTCLMTDDRSQKTVHMQMPVEKNISFSVVPAMIVALRYDSPPASDIPLKWQQELEDELLSTFDTINRHSSPEITKTLCAVKYVYPRRAVASLRTTAYFMKESFKI